MGQTGVNKGAGVKKIAYVEDDPDIVKVATLALERIGKFEVRAYPSGVAALAQLAEFAPQMILMDVMMPEMDGVTTFQKLGEDAALKQIPVIFMTAKVQPAEVQRYMRLGAVGVIAKPFDPIGLVEKVNELWPEAEHVSDHGSKISD